MVTGTSRFCSSHTWVMPTFSPTIALVAISFVLSPEVRRAQVPRHADAPHEHAGSAERFFGCAAAFPQRATADVSWAG